MICPLNARCSAIFCSIVPHRVVKSPRHTQPVEFLHVIRNSWALSKSLLARMFQRLLVRLADRLGHVLRHLRVIERLYETDDGALVRSV